MDAIDVKILRLLWDDGRMPVYKIAERVGISGAAVDKRINAMMRRGELLGFSVLLNPDRVMNSVVIAMRSRKKREDILKVVEKIRGVMHFISCLGGHHYGEFWYADQMELEEKLMLFKELTEAYSISVYHHLRGKRVELDRKDWQLLLAMKNDARIPFTKLSKIVGMSAKSLSRRWEKLRSMDAVKAYPIINRPFTKDIFWFSLFIEVDDIAIENRIRKLENLWRTSLFSEPRMVYGVFYAEKVRDMDTTMEEIICMKGVKRVQYEIIVEEKFFPDYLDYVAYKMGFRKD
ncbi:MAG: AsnC family transcriptional regulator [Euryarchaeota archaeon]|nr:AsnC family transcriptional regulator [Euryarchaeota archaeon]